MPCTARSDELDDYAKKKKLDLLVRASHGHGAFQSAILDRNERARRACDFALLLVRSAGATRGASATVHVTPFQFLDPDRVRCSYKTARATESRSCSVLMPLCFSNA